HTRSKRDWSSDVCSSDLGLAADLEDVPKPTGYQQRGRRCLSFDDGVGGYRGAVREVADRVGRPVFSAHRPVDSLQEAKRGVAREIGRASCRERGEEAVGW